MYTVEFEHDAAIITSLDERSEYEDVEVIIGDDQTVYIRQFDELTNEYNLIYMSYQQLLDLFASMQSPEGVFYLERKK
jgi:hypothetical protein